MIANRLGKGKCTGCDKRRVLYMYHWWSGRMGFPDGMCHAERYCNECVQLRQSKGQQC